MNTPLNCQNALSLIAKLTNPDDLRKLVANARQQGATEVAAAAERRLYEVSPAARPGSLEFDVWRSIHALEGTLTNERGKTTRLSRARQKIGRDGELKTVADLVVSKPSEGFAMLVARDVPDLTFEALALRHPKCFSARVLDAARGRLVGIGFAYSG
ncbi:MAG: hypothetical protein H0X36_04425 [Sphingomonadaceae bacterium]|nr:hypothetical protein [Sphingomonadaceae bacterium]